MEELPTPNLPAFENTVIYTITTMFIEGNEPQDLYLSYSEIPNQSFTDSGTGLSYLPPDSGSYQQFVSTYQYNKNKEVILSPVFNNMNGEYLICDDQYPSSYFVSDIDGDGTPELIQYVKRTSSSISYCTIYKISGRKIDKFFSIVPN